MSTFIFDKQLSPFITACKVTPSSIIYLLYDYCIKNDILKRFSFVGIYKGEQDQPVLLCLHNNDQFTGSRCFLWYKVF